MKMKRNIVKRSPNEASNKKARAMLAKLTSYEDWVATASQEQLDAAVSMAGGTRELYDQMLSSLLRSAGPDYELPERLK
jgi:hypothetical protein